MHTFLLLTSPNLISVACSSVIGFPNADKEKMDAGLASVSEINILTSDSLSNGLNTPVCRKREREILH